MRLARHRYPASYVRSFVFGVEDSIVSTVGLISGIAAAGVPIQTIVLTGSVLILVEAFSMAVGDFLSEESSERYVRRRAVPLRGPLMASAIMFGSYLVSGMIPLAPYVLLGAERAFWPSIAFSLAALALLGVVGGHTSKTSMIRGAVRAALIGGAAILVGITVGALVEYIRHAV
ncbi:hypothetical protein C4552_04480 [Candidatus Parcubacteria bacterium]|nr:MAG: hypothetical protein C4552_04480 [Candidatus Parcubacteria bacterium]